jgi:hypothetical protein
MLPPLFRKAAKARAKPSTSRTSAQDLDAEDEMEDDAGAEEDVKQEPPVASTSRAHRASTPRRRGPVRAARSAGRKSTPGGLADLADTFGRVDISTGACGRTLSDCVLTMGRQRRSLRCRHGHDVCGERGAVNAHDKWMTTCMDTDEPWMSCARHRNETKRWIALVCCYEHVYSIALSKSGSPVPGSKPS